MQTTTHYEVYEAGSGQWGLSARFNGRERQTAISHAQGIEERTRRPVAVIEETENLADAQYDIRLIHRSNLGGLTIRPPSSQSDIGSRMFMAVLTGVAIGAMVAVAVGSMLYNAAGDGGSGFLKVFVLGAFVIGAILGGSIMFRIYVPVGLILWNAKDADARKRTIMTLTHGAVVSSAADPPPEVGLGPGMMGAAGGGEAPSAVETASGFQTATVQVAPPPAPPAAPAAPATTEAQPAPPAADPAAPQAAAPATPAAAPAATDVAASAMESLMARVRTQLESFTDRIMTDVSVTHPMLNPSDRQAVSLYLAGAAQAVVDRNALDPMATLTLVHDVLLRSGLTAAEIEAFLLELGGEAERPKVRRAIETGTAGMASVIDDPASALSPTMQEVLAAWNDPTGQTATPPQQITFLLTDIVGSTALTSQIGNAGAQRVVRAHNAVCRAAAKAFKGREVKHTGDGMLMLFPDPAAGARAAMDIQQEAANYSADNPAAPLSLRLGLHVGDAVLEDGEYYGTAVSVVNGVCAVVSGGEICCTTEIRKKVAGPAFRFVELGVRTVKGSPTGIEVLKLLWEPKRQAPKGVVEYRHIGTAPSGPQSQ